MLEGLGSENAWVIQSTFASTYAIRTLLLRQTNELYFLFFIANVVAAIV